MVVDVFWLQLPPDFPISAVEVNGNGHIASVVIFLEQSGFYFLNSASHDPGAWHFDFWLFFDWRQTRAVAPQPHFFRDTESTQLLLTHKFQIII